MTYRRAVLMMVVAGSLWVSVSAQTTPLFRENCNGGAAYPLCGWTTHVNARLNERYTESLTAGGGPAGADYETVTLIGPVASGGDEQFAWGRAHTVSDAAGMAFGTTRYYRERIYPIGPFKFGDTGCVVPGNNVWTDKHIIINNDGGDPAGTNGRSIIELGPGSLTTNLSVFIQRGVGGSAEGTPHADLVSNQWNSLQWEIRHSSVSEATDGRYRQWVNNDTYASPTGESTAALEIDPTTGLGPGRFTSFSNTMWCTGGDPDIAVAFRRCCFEYDDAFDPNWHASATGGGGGAAGRRSKGKMKMRGKEPLLRLDPFWSLRYRGGVFP